MKFIFPPNYFWSVQGLIILIKKIGNPVSDITLETVVELTLIDPLLNDYFSRNRIKKGDQH